MGNPAIKAGNVTLLRGVPLDEATYDTCRDLLRPPEGKMETHRVLGISLIHGPDHCLDRWGPALRDGVDESVVIAPQTTTRSAAAAGADATSPGESTEHVSLDAPTNIPHLGSRITDVLYRWEDDASISVCLDSLTALLQAHPTSTVSQFVQVLRSHLLELDAAAHCHVDPTAHDDQTVAKLTTSFDEVVDARDEMVGPLK